MKYFEYDHLPPKLQEVSKPICELAKRMDTELPNGAEKSAGLRKLLEAKDCFVRASLEKKSGHFLIHLGEKLFAGLNYGRFVAGKMENPSTVSFTRRELAVEFTKDHNLTCDFEIVQESEINEKAK